MKEKSDAMIKDIGERKFLQLISKYVDRSILDFSDDASAIQLPSGDILVINVDMLVSKTDVLPGMSSEQIGKKAVTMSISDIIAKGVKPIGSLASVSFPGEIETEIAKKIIEGIKTQCNRYDCKFLGGDLNESDDIIIDIVSFGVCSENELIARKGAESGDLLYSTGFFGLTSLGFEILLKEEKIDDPLRSLALESVYEPTAKVDFLKLTQAFPIKVCMDSSDGLMVTLRDLSEVNNLGIKVINIPIHPNVFSYAKISSSNPLDLTFAGGEEFELVFAVSPEMKEQLEEKAPELGITLVHIGEFDTNITGVKITDSSFVGYDFTKEGFEHFKDSS